MDDIDLYCQCCGLELNADEIKEAEGSCFHCLKGNCELCGEAPEDMYEDDDRAYEEWKEWQLYKGED